MHFDSMNKEESELDSIFNRHLTSDTILNKVEVTFNSNHIQ
jgi:hypothetical protein